MTDLTERIELWVLTLYVVLSGCGLVFAAGMLHGITESRI